MLTPIGLTPEICLHSVRSGVSRLAIQRYPDRVNNWLVGGTVLTRTPHLKLRRLEDLADLALADVWKSAHINGSPPSGPLALLLGTAEAMRPGYRFPPDDFDANAWLERNGLPAAAYYETAPFGHASCQAALARAAELLAGGVRQCLVGAVDTHWQLRTLRWHENYERLKCSYINDGFMPGEAAAFMMVETASSAQDRGADIVASVLSVVIAREDATVLSDKPNTAAGLTSAVRMALGAASVASNDVQAVWCDLNGESYRGREWAFTELRNAFADHTELIHPADCHGDLGAASDIVLLGLAAQAQASGWAAGQPNLIFAGSDGGVRAATVVGPPPAPPRTAPLQVTVAVPQVLPLTQEVPKLGPDDLDPLETPDPPRAYFEWELRQEHRDELISLYYQRKALLHSQENEWRRVREPEQRILNHLDAAAASGPEAIWAIASGLQSQDEGSCFAGAMMLAVLANSANLNRLDECLQQPEEAMPNLTGVEAGLSQLRRYDLEPKINAWMDHDVAGVRAMAASLCGRLRFGSLDKLLPALRSDDPRLIQAAIGAVRRRRLQPATATLEGLLGHTDPGVGHDALLALLLLGSHRAADHCRDLCRNGYPPGVGAPQLLALIGELGDLAYLDGYGAGHPPWLDSIEAMGILGNVQPVPLLIDWLRADDDKIKTAVSQALELMLQSGLRETAEVMEPGEVEEGEQATVITVERTSTSWSIWSEWWRSHGRQFDIGTRWRRGQPFELMACVNEIDDDASQYEQRERAFWELSMHASAEIPFEPDWFVAYQLQSIEAWRAWLERGG
jgi:3-oxoacyl-[acyl-carrier-protein] synthase-1